MRLLSPDVCSAQVELGPHGLQFNAAVKLQVTVPAKACSGAFGAVALAALEGGRWQPLPTRAVDGGLEGDLRHFSTYGVVVLEPAPVRSDGNKVRHNGVEVQLDLGLEGDMVLSAQPDTIVLHAQREAGVGTYAHFRNVGTSAWWARVNAAQSQGPLLPDLNGSLDVPWPSGAQEATVVLQRSRGTLIVTQPEHCSSVLLGNMLDGRCQLTQDIADEVVISTDTFVLDCNGHTLRGENAGPGSIGLLSLPPTSLDVRNCSIDGFDFGLLSLGSTLFLRASTVTALVGGVHVLAGQQVEMHDNAGIRAAGPTANTGLVINLVGAAVSITHNTVEAPRVAALVGGATAPSAVRFNTFQATGGAADVTALGVLWVSDNAVEVRDNAIHSTATGVALVATAMNPVNGPRVFHNNVTAGGKTLVSVYSPQCKDCVPAPQDAAVVPIEASHDGEGNHHGRSTLPAFVPGVDSNDPTVTDSFPYCIPQGWALGVGPGDCAQPAALAPPVLTSPSAGAVVDAAAVQVSGSSNGSRVEVWEGGQMLASGPVANGVFTLQLPVLVIGAHTLVAFSVRGSAPLLQVSEGTSVSFRAGAAPPVSAMPAVTFPRAGQSIVATAVPVMGTAPPLSLVVVQLDAGAEFEVPSNAAGSWAAELAPLAPGQHQVRARAILPDGMTTAFSPAVGFTVLAPVTQSQPASAPSGRVTLHIVSSGQPVVSTLLGETSQTVYGTTARALQDTPQVSRAFTVVMEQWVDAAGSTYRLQGKATGHGVANVVEVNTVAVAFDGRDLLGRPPSVDTLLTRFSWASIGRVTRVRTASPQCMEVDTADRSSPFFGLDFSALPVRGAERGLAYCPIQSTDAVPTGTVLVSNAVLPTPVELGNCFNGITQGNLGGISRSVPDLTFCCLPSLADVLQWRVRAVEQNRGADARSLEYGVGGSQCVEPSYPRQPLCGVGAPLSPLGRGCVTETAAPSPGIGLSVCRLSGLDLLPQDPVGDTANVISPVALLRAGPVRIELSAFNRTVAVYTATLGNTVTAVDADGDGIRNSFDSCPSTPEPLGPALTAAGFPLLCGPSSGNPLAAACLTRNAADRDLDCRGDACDCAVAGGGAPCAEGSACAPALPEASTNTAPSTCVYPPPRVPTTPSDPLGDAFVTDVAKSMTIAKDENGEVILVGHTRQRCTELNSQVDGNAITAPCWFPRVLRWKTNPRGDATAWVAEDFTSLFYKGSDGYWPRVVTRLGNLPIQALPAGAANNLLNLIGGENQRNRGQECGGTPNLDAHMSHVVAADHHGDVTALGFVIADGELLQEPREGLWNAWTHLYGVLGESGEEPQGPVARRGRGMVILMEPGGQRTLVDVSTGNTFVQPDDPMDVPFWTLVAGVVVDRQDGSIWFAGLCGSGGETCLFNLVRAGAGFVSRRVDHPGLSAETLALDLQADPQGGVLVGQVPVLGQFSTNPSVLHCRTSGCRFVHIGSGATLPDFVSSIDLAEGGLGEVYVSAVTRSRTTSPIEEVGPTSVLLGQAYYHLDVTRLRVQDGQQLEAQPSVVHQRLSEPFPAQQVRFSSSAVHWQDTMDARCTTDRACALSACPAGAARGTVVVAADGSAHPLAYTRALTLDPGTAANPVLRDQNTGAWAAGLNVGRHIFAATKDLADGEYALGIVDAATLRDGRRRTFALTPGVNDLASIGSGPAANILDECEKLGDRVYASQNVSPFPWASSDKTSADFALLLTGNAVMRFSSAVSDAGFAEFAGDSGMGGPPEFTQLVLAAAPTGVDPAFRIVVTQRTIPKLSPAQFSLAGQPDGGPPDAGSQCVFYGAHCGGLVPEPTGQDLCVQLQSPLPCEPIPQPQGMPVDVAPSPGVERTLLHVCEDRPGSSLRTCVTLRGFGPRCNDIFASTLASQLRNAAGNGAGLLAALGPGISFGSPLAPVNLGWETALVPTRVHVGLSALSSTEENRPGGVPVFRGAQQAEVGFSGAFSGACIPFTGPLVISGEQGPSLEIVLPSDGTIIPLPFGCPDVQPVDGGICFVSSDPFHTDRVTARFPFGATSAGEPWSSEVDALTHVRYSQRDRAEQIALSFGPRGVSRAGGPLAPHDLELQFGAVNVSPPDRAADACLGRLLTPDGVPLVSSRIRAEMARRAIERVSQPLGIAAGQILAGASDHLSLKAIDTTSAYNNYLADLHPALFELGVPPRRLVTHAERDAGAAAAELVGPAFVTGLSGEASQLEYRDWGGVP